MLLPLATVDDVQERRLGGGVFSGAESIRVEALLVDASARVRTHTGQDITLGSHVETVRPVWHNRPFSDAAGPVTSGAVRLSQRPVVSVESVVAGTAPIAVAYQFDGIELTVGNLEGVVINATAAPSRAPVIVEYTAGLAEDDRDMDTVRGIVCQMVLRVFGVNPELAGLTQRSITNYSEGIGPVAAAGGIGLMDEEKATLDELFPKRSGVVWQR